MAGKRVGIVGTGISGMTLALRLQQLGVEPRIYSEITPEQHRNGRLPNTVVRFDHAIRRERELGLDLTGDLEPVARTVRVSIKGDPPLEFTGSTAMPMSAIDFRVLVPMMLDLYTSRGGELEVTGAPATPDDLDRWSGDHDLMVVAMGRRGITSLFEKDPSRSPYSQPQRILLAAFFRGITPPDPPGLSFNVSPGAGELFQMPFAGRSGRATNMLIEAVPGGPLEPVVRAPAEDPEALASTVLAAVQEHAPRIAEMIDPADFALNAPEDLLQGALTPVVRRAWAKLPGGKLAVAVGDAWITNDPITGQGANLASSSAWTMAGAIAGTDTFDEGFGTDVERSMLQIADPVTAWTNAFLQPPPEHLIGLLVACARDRRKADVFVQLFNEPAEMWRLVSDPARVEAFTHS